MMHGLKRRMSTMSINNNQNGSHVNFNGSIVMDDKQETGAKLPQE
jgi:hypothetical protein